jgi:2-(3-amino-3-carboxypropyl)histidine synthase
MDQTTIKTLYIFVEIAIDSSHLAQTIRFNFPDDRQVFHEALLDSEESDSKIPIGQQIGPSRNRLRIELGALSEGAPEEKQRCGEPTKLALVSTIQFVAALSRLKDDLTTEYANLADEPQQPRLWTGRYDATIPRSKPLSPGEILGCTAPPLNDVDALMFVFSAVSLTMFLYLFLSLVTSEMVDFTWNQS